MLDQTPIIPGYPVINHRGTFYKKGQIQQKNTRFIGNLCKCISILLSHDPNLPLLILNGKINLYDFQIAPFAFSKGALWFPDWPFSLCKRGIMVSRLPFLPLWKGHYGFQIAPIAFVKGTFCVYKTDIVSRLPLFHFFKRGIMVSRLPFLVLWKGRYVFHIALFALLKGALCISDCSF